MRNVQVATENYSTHRCKKEIPELYTAPCNGIVSHGPSIGGILVFADHTRGNKRKQNASTIFARCAAFHTFIFTLRLQDICSWWITVILIAGKTRIPQLEPNTRIKMAQVLGSPIYICDSTQNSGRSYIFSPLSDLTYCHKAVLSPVVSNFDWLYNLIILLILYIPNYLPILNETLFIVQKKWN